MGTHTPAPLKAQRVPRCSLCNKPDPDADTRCQRCGAPHPGTGHDAVWRHSADGIRIYAMFRSASGQCFRCGQQEAYPPPPCSRCRFPYPDHASGCMHGSAE